MTSPLLRVINLHDFPPQYFLLSNANLRVARFARLRTLQQLARPLAGQHDELEPVFLWYSFQLLALRAGVKPRPYPMFHRLYVVGPCYDARAGPGSASTSGMS